MPLEENMSPGQNIGVSLNLLGNLSNMKKLHTRKLETKKSTLGHFHRIDKCPEMQSIEMIQGIATMWKSVSFTRT